MDFLTLRQPGFALLAGSGLEIGGFEHPAQIERASNLIRCDRISTEEAAALFPELDNTRLPKVDVILDLDVDGLARFASASNDFVVCCHVLEHLKNPIKALSEIFRVLVKGGRTALAVPDKRFIFDRERPITEWGSVERIFQQNICIPTPDDYRDIARYIHPNLLTLPESELVKHLSRFMDRREHLNVWDSDAFLVFVERACKLLETETRPLYVSHGDRSKFELFIVLEKL